MTWEENGKYYGYPDCCIESFCDNRLFVERERVVQETSAHGFLPYLKHARMIKKGNIKLEDLITNRIHPQKFPQDRYIQSINYDD